MEMLEKRIADKDILRLIGKWLHVGVVEEGRLLMSENGTYQGSVISPILANIYLHEVLDLWVEHVVKPRMRGELTLYRFCDDFVMCIQHKDDAEKIQRVLPKRFGKYGLRLHPEKTKLIQFGRFAQRDCRRQGHHRPPTFNFLGFTLMCRVSRNGKFFVWQKTMSKRLGRGLRRVSEWCRNNRHRSVSEQAAHLNKILQGHYQYYGVRMNFLSLAQFHRGVTRLWRKWLSRRERGVMIPWVKFHRIMEKNPLVRPRITEGSKGYQPMLFGEFV